jgi:diguanylate cyclase (GGDEF)-like protein
MYKFLFSTDTHQALRMSRHLAAVLSLFIFTVMSIFFYYSGLYSIETETFVFILSFYWIGVCVFTFIIRSGLNLRFDDPSLTIPQMLWGTSFLLTITYLLNEWRGLILMAYFAMLSFGFFKLRFREFLSVALFAILGYTLIILYLFLYEPERLEIKLELLQLLTFSGTITVMLFTGSSIHKLREKTKQQYIALQDALEKNKTLAKTDELTGLYNRRYFMEKLSQQKALAEREDSDFVLCFCDLDHFKHINDTFGHHTGDIVLQKFGEILRSSIREIDYAARFGGEEFVCLLVNTDVNNAVKVTERIRESLANFNFNDIAPSLRATVSIGVSNFKQFNTIQETLMNADNRMYRAKQQGRNQVIYTDEDEVAAQI